MKIKYKIVSTDPKEHQIKVRFYSDLLPESELVSSWEADGVTPASYRTEYMLTLPIPRPDDLDAFIMAHCPVGWFAIKEAVANPDIDTSLKDIQVGVEKTVVV
jgi:hypothetical protein